MQSPLRILIADDHKLLLDGIISLIRNEKSVVVSATATTGYEVLDHLAEGGIDVCLLDISMPGMDGIETAKLVRQRFPEVKIIMLTTYADKEIVEELLGIGISGYMLKNCTKEQLLEAFQKVCRGSYYFSPEVEAVVMLDAERKRKSDTESEVTITRREKEILELLAKEYTNEKIAAALHISYRTVETHRKNLMQKTRSHNLAGLLKYAYSNKLVRV